MLPPGRSPRSFWHAAIIAALTATPAFALDIVINPGSALSSNSQALAAFNRAAVQWEALFSDPVTVNISANLVSIANPNVLGQASSVELSDSFNTVRGLLIADAGPTEPALALLPTAAQFSAYLPSGFTFLTSAGQPVILGSKANFKALGYDPTLLDTLFGVSDATIEFNSNFTFDYDNSDGVTSGTVDFESVAAHEIGHALGFLSIVDTVDTLVGNGQTAPIAPFTLDLFRFSTADQPTSLADFTLTPRSLLPQDPSLWSDFFADYNFSTGVAVGDGRQASHWKDDVLTGSYIGLMDPTLTSGVIAPITQADIRALGYIGWNVVPEASTATAATVGALSTLGILAARRRSKGSSQSPDSSFQE
jgi:hypothetical protein